MGKCLSCSHAARTGNSIYLSQDTSAAPGVNPTHVECGDTFKLSEVSPTSNRDLLLNCASFPCVNDRDEKTSCANKIINTSSCDKQLKVSDDKISEIFEHYKETDEDAILEDGLIQFCEDLCVHPEDIRILILAWKFKAEHMCRFTRSEFIKGCKTLNIDSIEGIKQKFPELLLEIQNKELFRDMYKYTFFFGLDPESSQKSLPVDIAISLWKVLFTNNEPVILEKWFSFLLTHPTIQYITRDSWNMFLHFVETVSTGFDNYDGSLTWPSLFDDFVEYAQDQINQNVDTKEIADTISPL